MSKKGMERINIVTVRGMEVDNFSIIIHLIRSIPYGPGPSVLCCHRSSLGSLLATLATLTRHSVG